jgi:hypothetical protein
LERRFNYPTCARMPVVRRQRHGQDDDTGEDGTPASEVL